MLGILCDITLHGMGRQIDWACQQNLFWRYLLTHSPASLYDDFSYNAKHFFSFPTELSNSSLFAYWLYMLKRVFNWILASPGVRDETKGDGSHSNGHNYEYSRWVFGSTLDNITRSRSHRYESSQPVSYPRY